MLIAIVAGELSGDILGARLIKALRQHYPDAVFQGIGGEQMQAQGFESLWPLEKLSVMGLVEVVKHLPELLAIQKQLYRHFSRQKPAVFIGIDAPDFNLRLEQRLRQQHIPTVHYVSPTVWAWRRRRVKKIAKAVDLMLTLFPFEAAFYQDHNIPVSYVGHPLADEIPLTDQQSQARQSLSLENTRHRPILALLPGSRFKEVQLLAPLFIDAAQQLKQRFPDLNVLIPAPTARIQNNLTQFLNSTDLSITLIAGQSRNVIGAADIVLMASGTATLEALLLGRPMVVAYRLAPLTAWIAKRLVKAPYFALPNLLAKKALVPEFFQQAATAKALAEALTTLLDDVEQRSGLQQEFQKIHQQLRRNASEQAAGAIIEMLKQKTSS